MEDIKLSKKQKEPISTTVKMSISSVINKDNEKKIYVLFQDGKKMAELVAPTGKIMSNMGFSEDEIEKLTNYVKEESEYIASIAKNVSPMKAFLGRRQG